MPGVAVPTMQQKDGLFETVAKGLGVASSILGIKADMAKIDAAKAADAKKADMEAAQARGLRTPAELAELSKTHDFSDSPVANAVKLYRKDEQGKESPLWASVRQKTEAPKTRTIKEYDPKTGNTYEKIVADTVGGSYLQEPPKKDSGGEDAGPKLAPDQKKIVETLATKNANKTSIATQLEADLTEFMNAKTEDDKVKIGQSMLKTLNSPEGADAVGVEEAKRMGSFLEYKIANAFEPGSFWGRDLDLFQEQVQSKIRSINSSVAANQKKVDEILGRRSPEPAAPTAVAGQEKPQSGTAYAAPASGPKPGTVESGYRFKGGDPADKANWEKVK